MAIENSTEPMKPFDRRFRRTAGAVSGALALGGLAWLIMVLASEPSAAASLKTLVVALAVLAGLVALASVMLVVSEQSWSQRALLVFWLTTAVAAGAGMLAVVVSRTQPAWWTLQVPILVPVPALRSLCSFSPRPPTPACDTARWLRFPWRSQRHWSSSPT